MDCSQASITMSFNLTKCFLLKHLIVCFIHCRVIVNKVYLCAVKWNIPCYSSYTHKYHKIIFLGHFRRSITVTLVHVSNDVCIAYCHIYVPSSFVGVMLAHQYTDYSLPQVINLKVVFFRMVVMPYTERETT